MPHMATDVCFISRDGFPLQGTVYYAQDQRLNAVAVFAPGIGIPYIRYKRLFDYLSAHGVAVLGFDYRGIGANAYESIGHLKKANPGAEEWGGWDLSAAIDFTLDHLAVANVIGIGHSFGGTAFGLIDNPEKISGLVLISSSSGYLGHYSGMDRLKKALYMGLLIPMVVQAKGYLPARFYRGRHALPGKLSRQWASWCFSSDYIKASYDRSSFSKLKVPLFALGFHDDPIANESATNALAGLFDGCAVATTFYQEGDYGHNAILSSHCKNAVWPYVVECVNRASTKDVS